MRRWLLACLVCALAAAPTAHAQAPGDLELAKRYYSLGEELYQRSNFEGALAQFQRAYKVAAKPDLLYNIARCYEALSKPKEAISHYRRYLAQASPSDKDRAIVEARLANLERKAKQEAARVAAAEAERKRREQSEREAKAAREAAERSKRAGGRNTLAIAGWSAAGTGAALVVVGAILGGVAKGKASSLEDANRNGTEFSEVASDLDAGQNLETASIGLLIGGGVAALAGGVLLFLHYRGSSERRRAGTAAPRLVVMPVFTPQGASLGATYRF